MKMAICVPLVMKVGGEGRGRPHRFRFRQSPAFMSFRYVADKAAKRTDTPRPKPKNVKPHRKLPYLWNTRRGDRGGMIAVDRIATVSSWVPTIATPVCDRIQARLVAGINIKVADCGTHRGPKDHVPNRPSSGANTPTKIARVCWDKFCVDNS